MVNSLLEVQDLRKHFPVRAGVFSRVMGHIRAVNDVTFSIEPGEVFGLVGESGCGKTTTGKMVLRLIKPTSGKVIFEGIDIMSISGEDMRRLRRKMQIIFQDPYASLNPRMTVGSIVSEPFHIHKIGNPHERLGMSVELLAKVGIGSDSLNRYPHEFSDGQRQRIGIARAIALKPKLIVCDEPLSALDVSIQAQVTNLLMDLRAEQNMAYLFISHDLSVVEHMCDRVAVMYLGKIVEEGSSYDVYSNPIHPYTEALLSATPQADPKSTQNRILLKGDVPSPMNPPDGCVFHTRCPIATFDCKKITPQLEAREPGHRVACIVK